MNEPSQPPTVLMWILKCDLLIFFLSPFESLKWHICLFSFKANVWICLPSRTTTECSRLVYGDVHCQTHIAFEHSNLLSSLCSFRADFGLKFLCLSFWAGSIASENIFECIVSVARVQFDFRHKKSHWIIWRIFKEIWIEFFLLWKVHFNENNKIKSEEDARSHDKDYHWVGIHIDNRFSITLRMSNYFVHFQMYFMYVEGVLLWATMIKYVS